MLAFTQEAYRALPSRRKYIPKSGSWQTAAARHRCPSRTRSSRLAVAAIELTPIYKSRVPWASATGSDRSATSIKRWGCARVRDREAAGSTGCSTATFNPFSTGSAVTWLIQFVAEHRDSADRQIPPRLMVCPNGLTRRRVTKIWRSRSKQRRERPTGRGHQAPLLANIYLHHVYDQWGSTSGRQLLRHRRT